MKYFPDKPDDVTCETCPYLLREAARPRVGSLGMYCARNPVDVTNSQMGAIVDDKANWCGEHPWFVWTRTQQDEINRTDASIADCVKVPQ